MKKQFVIIMITIGLIFGLVNICEAYTDNQIANQIIDDLNQNWYDEDVKRYGVDRAERLQQKYLSYKFQQDLYEDIILWVRTLTPYEKSTGNIDPFSKLGLVIIGGKFGIKLAMIVNETP